MKVLFYVERIGNRFVVGRSKCAHYYTALILGDAKITGWRRTTLKNILENYRRIEE